MKLMQKCRKLQFLEQPLEAGSKSEIFPLGPHVKMSNFTDIYMFAVCYKKQFWFFIANFLLHDNCTGFLKLY